MPLHAAVRQTVHLCRHRPMVSITQFGLYTIARPARICRSVFQSVLMVRQQAPVSRSFRRSPPPPLPPSLRVHVYSVARRRD